MKEESKIDFAALYSTLMWMNYGCAWLLVLCGLANALAGNTDASHFNLVQAVFNYGLGMWMGKRREEAKSDG